MNKLTWEEFKNNQSVIIVETDAEKEILLQWFKENDYEYSKSCNSLGIRKFETFRKHNNEIPEYMLPLPKYSVHSLDWKKDRKVGYDMADAFDDIRRNIARDCGIPERMMFPTRSIGPNLFDGSNLRFTIDGKEYVPFMKSLTNDKVFPKVEMLNFNKDKGTTTIKFKNGNVVQSKVNPKETFNEFTGVLVTLLKEVTGMTNQELQGYFKYIMRKEIK